MFANRYQINLSTLASGATATTINIPINMEYQLVDQGELIERVFVQVEVEKAINPIDDYEKVRFLPLIFQTGGHVDKLTYNLTMSGGAITYAAIGFTDDDIKFEKNNFKQTFLNLAFYDTDNPLDQRLITDITIYSHLTSADLQGSGATNPGQPLPANNIGLSFVVENPIITPRGFAEGYHIYDYKDEINIGDTKYLYMRASFKNAKTGRSTNLMVQSAGASIDNLVHLLYTRYKLIRNTSGYYYEIDDSYHGDGSVGLNNVTYGASDATINLYQIKAL